MTFRRSRLCFLWMVLTAVASLATAQMADLQLSKSASASSVRPGDPLTYGLRVDNLGPDSSAGGEVVDSLPNEVSLVGADPGCVYDALGHEVTCTLPGLASGGHVIFTIDTVVDNLSLPLPGAVSAAYVSGGVGGSGEVYLLDPQGPPHAVTGPSLFTAPRGVARDSSEELLVADGGFFDPFDEFQQPVLDGVIWRVDRASGARTVVSSGGLLVTPDGIQRCGDLLYVADRFGIHDDGNGQIDPGNVTGRILSIDPTNGQQALIAENDHLMQPTGIDCDVAGGLLVSDAFGVSLIRVDLLSGAQTLITQGGYLDAPRAVAWESPTTALVVDSIGGIVRVDLSSGAQTLVVPPPPLTPELLDPHDIEVDRQGGIWVTDRYSGGGGSVLHFDGGSGLLLASWPAPPFEGPQGFELVEGIVNRAEVFGEDVDPDPANNSAITVTEVEPDDPMVVVIDIVEAVAVDDSVQIAPSVLISVGEQILVSDGPWVRGAIEIRVDENIQVIDQVALRPAILLDIGETITVTDSASVLPHLTISLQESITVSDAVSAQPAVWIAIDEAVAVSDQLTPLSVDLGLDEAILVTDDVAIVIQDPDGPPTVVWIQTVAQQPKGKLEPGDRATASITQAYVRFNKTVFDPTGDTDPDDVTNPENYLLVEAGPDGVIDTLDCATGWNPSDIRIPVDSVLYPAIANTSAVFLDGGVQLLEGSYRLFVCGTTSIADLDGNKLDGDGDGTPGDDYRLSFSVPVNNALANPNFDQALAGWTLLKPPGTQLEAVADDAGEAPTSGAARMANLAVGGTMGLAQCLPADPERWHGATARLELQSPSIEWPHAAIVLRWFDAPDCSGANLREDSLWLRPNAGTEAWPRFRQWRRSPEGTSSVEVAFAADAAEGEDFTALWDDVGFFEDPSVVFIDGFESGSTSAWSSP